MDKSGKDGKAGAFLEYVRRLVPEYATVSQSDSGMSQRSWEHDGMIEAIIALLKIECPREMLDIGSGVGNVDMLILDNTPASRIDCIEISPEMARASVSSLSRYMDRAKVIMKDVMDFNPGQKYDAILSNLVLRNMKPEEKEKLLGRIKGWLKPGGMFIWGDLIRHEETKEEPKGQKKFSGLRMRFPLRKGAEKKMAKEEAAEKEPVHEYPLTEEETAEIANRAGFSDIRTAWKRGSFAVFRLRA